MIGMLVDFNLTGYIKVLQLKPKSHENITYCIP